MTPSMPPAEIWVQFAVVAVVVMSTLLIGGMFYKLWQDLLAWQEKQAAARAVERAAQDTQRELEREKQREWEASQAKQRDEQWQSFLRNMQANWAANDVRNTAVLQRLIEKVDDLTVSINNHDTYVRAAGTADRPPARRKSSRDL